MQGDWLGRPVRLDNVYASSTTHRQVFRETVYPLVDGLTRGQSCSVVLVGSRVCVRVYVCVCLYMCLRVSVCVFARAHLRLCIFARAFVAFVHVFEKMCVGVCSRV